MKVTTIGRIDGALLFQPTPHTDERGFFSRTFDAEVARAVGIDPDGFAQDSLSRSVQGVVRGMHLRSGAGESKLVRCSYGAVFDVVVDLRPGSPTFLNWASFELRDTEQTSLYVPAGCAHGFQALTDPADVSYRIDRPHDPSEDVSIAFDDPELAIPWPLPVTVMSKRDEGAKSLASALDAICLVRSQWCSHHATSPVPPSAVRYISVNSRRSSVARDTRAPRSQEIILPRATWGTGVILSFLDSRRRKQAASAQYGSAEAPVQYARLVAERA